MLRTFNTIDNHQFTITIPPPSQINSFFVFALPKSGSVMQDRIIENICKLLDIPAITVPKTAFNQGVKEDELRQDICDIFTPQGYCFYGHRRLSVYLEKVDLSKFKKSLLVRDPRDILVSHYFSMKESHAIPKGKVGEELLKNRTQLQDINIDSYVIGRAPYFRTIFVKYFLLEDQKFKLFRYEDVVFNKSQWIADILSFFDLELKQGQIDQIAKKQDIFPSEENTSVHIRQVTPGDHKRKLRNDTIENLNNIFKDILIKYNYDF